GRLPAHRRGRLRALSTSGRASFPSQMTRQMVSQLRTQPPFSFTHDGRPSSILLAQWSRRSTSRALDPRRTEHVVAWTDPHAALVVRCVAVEYHDLPTVEWTLYFKNTGATALPPVGEILAVDTSFTARSNHEFVLHTCNGSLAVVEDFGLHHIPLPAHAN